jgi:hypothetical protein
MSLHDERHAESPQFLLILIPDWNYCQYPTRQYPTFFRACRIFPLCCVLEAGNMRGTLVIARDYSGRALVRRIWESGSKLVYLSDERQFQQLSTGKNGLTPVGFPVEDVFVYDPNAVQAIRDGSLDWSSLQNFDALSGQNQVTICVK